MYFVHDFGRKFHFFDHANLKNREGGKCGPAICGQASSGFGARAWVEVEGTNLKNHFVLKINVIWRHFWIFRRSFSILWRLGWENKPRPWKCMTSSRSWICFLRVEEKIGLDFWFPTAIFDHFSTKFVRKSKCWLQNRPNCFSSPIPKKKKTF